MFNRQCLYLNADADTNANAEKPMLRFPNGLLSIYRGPPTFKNKDLFCLHEFLMIFTVVKILAKLRTTWTQAHYGVVRGYFFECLWIVWGFLWCLWMWACVKLPLLQVRVLTMSFLQLFLLSYWSFDVKCWLLFWDACVCLVTYQEPNSQGGGGGGDRPPLSFFENWKNCPNNGKNNLYSSMD